MTETLHHLFLCKVKTWYTASHKFKMWIHKTKYCRYQNWIPIENLWLTRVRQSYINQYGSSRNARHSCCVALRHYWSQFSTLSKQVISKWDLSVTPYKHTSGFFELYFSNVELLCKYKTKKSFYWKNHSTKRLIKYSHIFCI